MRYGTLVGFVVLLLCAASAEAQVQLAPGEALKQCNTFASSTFGGIRCAHVPDRRAVVVIYDSPDWYATFWGDGTAASVLPRLCLDLQLVEIQEVVMDRSSYLVRTRTAPCSTGAAPKWTIVPYRKRKEVLE